MSGSDIPSRDRKPQPILELTAALPPRLVVISDISKRLLGSLPRSGYSVAPEYLGTNNAQWVQWAIEASEAERVENQCQSWLPEAVFKRESNRLASLFNDAANIGISELGLDMELLVPLTTFSKLDSDPLLSLWAVLRRLRFGEGQVYQILFEPLRYTWVESMCASVEGADGRPVSANASLLPEQVKAKVASPLFGVFVRLAVGTSDESRYQELLRLIKEAVAAFGSNEKGNVL